MHVCMCISCISQCSGSDVSMIVGMPTCLHSVCICFYTNTWHTHRCESRVCMHIQIYMYRCGKEKANAEASLGRFIVCSQSLSTYPVLCFNLLQVASVCSSSWGDCRGGQGACHVRHCVWVVEYSTLYSTLIHYPNIVKNPGGREVQGLGSHLGCCLSSWVGNL